MRYRVIEIYVLLGFAFGIVFHYLLVVRKDARFKRQIFPLFGVFYAAYGSGLFHLVGFPLWILLVTLPVAALIWFWQSKVMKFCLNCGSTVNGRLGVPPVRCSKCGGEALI
jgi:hypothetical protein